MLRGSRREFPGWTPGTVKLLLPPRQSRGNSHWIRTMNTRRFSFSPIPPPSALLSSLADTSWTCSHSDQSTQPAFAIHQKPLLGFGRVKPHEHSCPDRAAFIDRQSSHSGDLTRQHVTMLPNPLPLFIG